MLESYGRYELACKDKKKYATFDDAKADAKRLRKRVGARIKPYMCKHCQMWHNGHLRHHSIKTLKGKVQKSIDNHEHL